MHSYQSVIYYNINKKFSLFVSLFFLVQFTVSNFLTFLDFWRSYIDKSVWDCQREWTVRLPEL